MEPTPTVNTAARREIIAGRQYSLGGLLVAVTSICACMALAPNGDPFAFSLLGPPAAILRTIEVYRLRKLEGATLSASGIVRQTLLSSGLMIALWFAAIVLLPLVLLTMRFFVVGPLLHLVQQPLARAGTSLVVGLGAVIYLLLIWQTWPTAHTARRGRS